MPTIDDVLERVQIWNGRDPVATALTGGLTNANYVVQAGADRFVVRIPGASTDLLAVDRANERHNAEAAATTGVSPAIVEYLAEWDVMVLPFIDGETMSAERLREPAMPARIASSLQRLHAGPRFLRDFDMFRTVEYYLGIVEEHDIIVPDGYLDRMDTVAEVERVLAVNALPRVPCHNDLLAENYIDDGHQLWIIDFEYSGNDDPCFELGDTAQECAYDEASRAALCEAYFGHLESGQAREDGVVRDDGRRGLDALGGDPSEDLLDRLRLLRLGPGAVGPGRTRGGRSEVRRSAAHGRPLIEPVAGPSVGWEP